MPRESKYHIFSSVLFWWFQIMKREFPGQDYSWSLNKQCGVRASLRAVDKLRIIYSELSVSAVQPAGRAAVFTIEKIQV